ncbi:MAG: ion transporter, partial [Muribaculaceae bacterium]|nr:ion transporter [Muribaculaceae bacterium]
MGKINNWCYSFVYGKPFDLFIILVILINSILIGVQATYTNTTINVIQDICLYIFTIEVVLRFIAAGNMKRYFSSGWNVFDLILVIIGWLPADEGGNSLILVLRVLRVFRVLRLLRTADELKLIVDVLIRSLKSLLYNGMLFFIFLYLYAVIGVTIFRLPTPDKLHGEELQRYEQMMTEAPHSPTNSPDPFGSIGEAFFTLFRALTGEDWTDLRYNLVTAADYGLVKVHPSVVTVYHVSWFCLAAFLLLNLVTGAVI